MTYFIVIFLGLSDRNYDIFCSDGLTNLFVKLCGGYSIYEALLTVLYVMFS